VLLLSEFVANTMVRHGITAGERDHLTMPAQLPIQGQSRLLLESRQERKQPLASEASTARWESVSKQVGNLLDECCSSEVEG